MCPVFLFSFDNTITIENVNTITSIRPNGNSGVTAIGNSTDSPLWSMFCIASVTGPLCCSKNITFSKLPPAFATPEFS